MEAPLSSSRALIFEPLWPISHPMHLGSFAQSSTRIPIFFIAMARTFVLGKRGPGSRGCDGKRTFVQMTSIYGPGDRRVQVLLFSPKCCGAGSRPVADVYISPPSVRTCVCARVQARAVFLENIDTVEARKQFRSVQCRHLSPSLGLRLHLRSKREQVESARRGPQPSDAFCGAEVRECTRVSMRLHGLKCAWSAAGAR